MTVNLTGEISAARRTMRTKSGCTPHRPDGALAFDWPLYHILAPAVKQAANELAVPLVWGGDWEWKDGPHFELDRKKYPA